MADITAIPGIADLRRHTGGGDPRVCVAVLDGPVDLDHSCFAGADLTPLATLASGRGMSRRGTHVASVIFGRHDGPVPGLAPGCRGLIVPIFADEEGHLSQLDLARAPDPAVEAGAQVSNVSGGPKVPTSAAEDLLARDDPARPRPERADRRRSRERRLHLSARPRRGGVHRGGAPGPLLNSWEDRS
jgi:subtilisin family serine protease